MTKLKCMWVQFGRSASELRDRDDLITAWSRFSICLKQALDNKKKVFAVLPWQMFETAFLDFATKLIHVACFKWQFQGDHFV